MLQRYPYTEVSKMVLRAPAQLSGAVTANKGDDVSHHPAEILNPLMARGLVFDDGKDYSTAAVLPAPKTRKRPRRKG